MAALKGAQAEAYEKMLKTIEENNDVIRELDKEIQQEYAKIKQAVPAQIRSSKGSISWNRYSNWTTSLPRLMKRQKVFLKS